MLNTISNTERIVSMIYRYMAYIHFVDGNRALNSAERNPFLIHEENYKSTASIKAKNKLAYDEWDETWIGSGKILDRAHQAMNCAGNLVNKNQQTQFKNKINPNHEKYRPESERALYDIYKSKTREEERTAFAQAIKVFGGHYDTIAFLFFAKDVEKYLPVASETFEKNLSSIGIVYQMASRCSWENYTGFIDIVKMIQGIMQECLPGIAVRLIDAHSFLWVINEEEFSEWNPDASTVAEIEASTEQYLITAGKGGVLRRSRLANFFTRSAEVAKATKDRAHGVCQLCGKRAPFIDRQGVPYLEAHHIIWLSKGGKDSTDNTVALCPNCHTKMHVVDDPADVEILLKKAK